MLWQVNDLQPCLLSDRYWVVSRPQATRSRHLTNLNREPTMTSRIPETVNWHLVTIMGDTMPPRDPEDDDEEEDDDTEREDDREPAVIREPDEDE
jgi:hypothetical protein